MVTFNQENQTVENQFNVGELSEEKKLDIENQLAKLLLFINDPDRIRQCVASIRKTLDIAE